MHSSVVNELRHAGILPEPFPGSSEMSNKLKCNALQNDFTHYFATEVNLALAERSVNVVENPVNSQMKDTKSRSAREREGRKG